MCTGERIDQKCFSAMGASKPQHGYNVGPVQSLIPPRLVRGHSPDHPDHDRNSASLVALMNKDHHCLKHCSYTRLISTRHFVTTFVLLCSLYSNALKWSELIAAPAQGTFRNVNSIPTVTPTHEITKYVPQIVSRCAAHRRPSPCAAI